MYTTATTPIYISSLSLPDALPIYGGTLNGGVDLDQSPNTITINVTPVNDAPQGTDKTVTTLEDTAFTVTAPDFGLSDPLDSTPNSPLAIKITKLPASGSMTHNWLP